jgi:hypothetical protein
MFTLPEIKARLEALPYGGTTFLNGLRVVRWDKHSYTVGDQAHAINGAAHVLARQPSPSNEKGRVA